MKIIKSFGKKGWFSIKGSLVHNKERHRNASLYGKAGGCYSKDIHIKIVPKKEFFKVKDVKQFKRENPNYQLFGITKPDKIK